MTSGSNFVKAGYCLLVALKIMCSVGALVFFSSGMAQSVTVKADFTPDESISQVYMSLDRACRDHVNHQGDAALTVATCKKISDEADKFQPQSHFITRRGAYVFYTIALLQANMLSEAVKRGDKAVGVVALGHDDHSGASVAYFVRGQEGGCHGILFVQTKTLKRQSVMSKKHSLMSKENSCVPSIYRR